VPIDLSKPLEARSEYARLVSQDRYRVLFNSDVVGMAIGRCDGTLVEVNAACATMLGYTREELCRLGWRQITPEDQRHTDEIAIRSLEVNGQVPTFEKELVHKDGSRVSILIGCARLSDGDVISYIIDNRGRKRAEAALAELNGVLQQRIADSNNELRSLAAHLETVREEQNTKLAREIHDVLGQELTGLRMDAAMIARKLGDAHPAERERLAEMQTRVDHLIASVREIARELRPKILDDLGLCAALDAHAREWSARSGVPVDLELPESLEIDRERATAMFRIFQELLTNVARHAGAKSARARLYFDAGEQYIGLDFYDDGRGMKTETTSSSLGLLGIRERLVTYSGELAISSAPDVGTRVHVRLPLGVPGCAS
jgi:PAS domain S-box-containing protein